MIYFLIFGAMFVIGLWFYVWHKVTQSAIKVIGSPTPEEARIQAQTDDITQKIEVQAEKDKQEIANADKQSLLKSFRGLLTGSVRKK